MKPGVRTMYPSPSGDSSATSPRAGLRVARKTLRAALPLAGVLSGLVFASGAFAAPATVGMGTAASFSVLGGSTVTNTGPTTMFGDLGLSPGSSVTGAPHVLGQTHVDDAVAIGAKNALTTAYNDAASRPSDGSAGTDLAGQTFSPGVHTASSSLLLSSGSVTLNAQGDPNAVFIFQIGSTLTTGSSTSVQLVNGAQACNVFWQVGSSATLGTGTRFVGTVMASATITANTAATIHGRLLAQTGAVNLDTNTITTSNCSTGGTETNSPAEAAALAEATSIVETVTAHEVAAGPAPTALTPSANSKRVAALRTAARRAAARRAARRHHRKTTRHVSPRPALPHTPGGFTG